MLTDLATTPFAETLRALAASRSSGDLQVQSGKVVKTIFFDHGRIVFAASNLKKDRLGEALVALGRITDEQFSQASALLGGERKRRFGEALVHSGIMDKTELGRSVARRTTAAPASPKSTVRCRKRVFQASSSGVGGTSARPSMYSQFAAVQGMKPVWTSAPTRSTVRARPARMCASASCRP